MTQYFEETDEREELDMELNSLALAHHQQQNQDEELYKTKSKWNIEESTHYQTHRSFIFSHSSSHQQWVSVNKGHGTAQSNSPAKPRRALYPQFQPSHQQQINTTPKGQFAGFKIQKIECSPQKAIFRSRVVQRNPNKSTIHCILNFTNEPPPQITASSYCAIFTHSNEILTSHNHEERRQIASLTKIMTAYTVLSICHEYNIKVRQLFIPILNRASYMEGTSANLRSGEEILVIDLLYGLLLPSGNDAGTALAQYFGKFLSFKFVKDNFSNERYASNIEKFNQCKQFYDNEYERQSIKLFVFEMNKYAHSLGLLNTRFINPTGLSHADNYSTAKDMAVLTAACLHNGLLRAIFKKKVHKCEVRNDKLGYNREVVWKNTNKHLYKIPECIGVKTGITPGAGPCLSSAYRIGSHELVVVLLNCSNLEVRYTDAELIYKWSRCKYNSSISV